MVKGCYRYISKELDLLIKNQLKTHNKNKKKDKISFKEASKKLAMRLKK
jgi:hypothetical protein